MGGLFLGAKRLHFLTLAEDDGKNMNKMNQMQDFLAGLHACMSRRFFEVNFSEIMFPVTRGVYTSHITWTRGYMCWTQVRLETRI